MRVLAQINMQGSKSSAVVDEGDLAFTINAMHGHDMHAVLITMEEKPVKNVAESQLSMFSSEEHPASPSALQDLEKDWQTRVATSC